MDYRVAITKLKNSDDWTSLSAEVRRDIVKQEKALIDLSDAKNIPNDNWGVPDNVFINGKTKQDILTIPKGERPAPETYLSSSYIQQHLGTFNNEGGAFIVVKSWIEEGNFTYFPNRKFVMLKSDMRNIIDKYRETRNIQFIEDALGYKSGVLTSLEDEIFVFYVDRTKFKFDLPDGNEIGVNYKWLPGGKTSGGYHEASCTY